MSHTCARRLAREDSTVIIEQEQITPMRAKLLLDTSPGNRSLSRSTVRQYSRMMSEGKWPVTGDTIKIDEHGHLMDGHHRLAACVDSGSGFCTLVAYGVQRGVFAVIDNVRPRRGADVFIGGKRTRAHAAIASWMWRLDTRPVSRWRYDRPHNLEIRETFDRHADQIREVSESLGHLPFRCRQRSAISAVFAIGLSVDEPVAREMIRGFYSGDGLPRQSPITALRNTIMRRQTAGFNGGAASVTTIELTIRAWNYVAAGTSTSRITYMRNVPNMDGWRPWVAEEAVCSAD